MPLFAFDFGSNYDRAATNFLLFFGLIVLGPVVVTLGATALVYVLAWPRVRKKG
jgi:hypothetical protein